MLVEVISNLIDVEYFLRGSDKVVVICSENYTWTVDKYLDHFKKNRDNIRIIKALDKNDGQPSIPIELKISIRTADRIESYIFRKISPCKVNALSEDLLNNF